jgi:hypothetical protein
VAGNVTIFEIVPPAIVQNRVLPTQETAVPERKPVAIESNSEGLADGPSRIFKGNVLSGKVIRVNAG